MSEGDRSRAEQVFEQSLLESARLDAAPANVEQAWANFSRIMSGATAHIEPSSGLHRIHNSHTPPVARVTTAGAGLTKAMVLLAAGAIGGVAVTLALQGAYKNRAAPVHAQILPPMAAASSLNFRPRLELAVHSGAASESSREPSGNRYGPSTLMSKPNAPMAIAANIDNSRTTAQEPSAAAPSATSEVPSSELALEVQRLDSIRSAGRAHAYAEVLRLVAGYHREFPKGALGPDADVLALEALAERHDYAQLAARASAFLSQYPKDPHASKVRKWAEIASNNPKSAADLRHRVAE